ncbi:MAG: zinc-dependent metalloprotease [Bacteriovoracia bacterium]
MHILARFVKRGGVRSALSMAGGALLLLVFSACTSPAPMAVMKPADPDPARSFRVISQNEFAAEFADQAGPIAKVDRFYLGLRKDALDREFLLSASLIPQTPAATSEGLRGRIVTFRRYGESIFMLESTDGHVVAPGLPAKLILAELPILSQKDDLYVLDFNEGMQRVFVSRGWYGRDDETTYGDSRPFAAIEVINSFVDRMRIHSGLLEVRQFAQFRDDAEADEVDDESESGGISYSTVEVRYYLRPYAPSRRYTPLEGNPELRMGFFEIAPRIESSTGKSVSYVSRWDLSRPVTFAVSADTPAEYVQAVKDGVTYWNQALGRDVLRVELAPAGVTAPDPDYNVIQWVPWDRAGFAYADVLMDPRTGEIRHAQIFMTSVFAFDSRTRAELLLRILRERPDRRHRVGIRFLPPAHLCGRKAQGFTESLAAGLEEVLTAHARGDLDDADLLRVSQDMVRSVAAHEVGHTLGLRHNFAGNLASNLTSAQRAESFAAYLRRGEIVDPSRFILTSSIMDYLTFSDDVMTGGQIARQLSPPRYDTRALRYLYTGLVSEPTREGGDPYCSDAGMGVYLDCRDYDDGARTLAFNAQAIRAVQFEAPYRFVEDSLRGEPRRPEELLESLVDPFLNSLGWLRRGDADGFRSIGVEHAFPFAGAFPLPVPAMYAEKVRTARFAAVARDVKEMGGVDRAFFASLAPGFAEAAQANLREYLESAANAERIPPADRRRLLAEAELYFPSLELEWHERMWRYLANTPEAGAKEGEENEASSVRYEHPELSAEVETVLSRHAAAVVLDAEGGAKITGTFGKVSVTVQAFRHPRRMRELAVGALAARWGIAPDWMMDERAQLRGRLVSQIEAQFGKAPDEIEDREVSRPLRAWLMEQKTLIEALR